MIPGKSVCPITAQFHSIVRKFLSTVSAFSQFFQSSTVDWKISNLLKLVDSRFSLGNRGKGSSNCLITDRDAKRTKI